MILHTCYRAAHRQEALGVKKKDGEAGAEQNQAEVADADEMEKLEARRDGARARALANLVHGTHTLPACLPIVRCRARARERAEQACAGVQSWPRRCARCAGSVVPRRASVRSCYSSSTRSAAIRSLKCASHALPPTRTYQWAVGALPPSAGAHARLHLHGVIEGFISVSGFGYWVSAVGRHSIEVFC